MCAPTPPEPVYRKELVAHIAKAFARVRRQGGTSWSEALAIDRRASAIERIQARNSDTESDWSEMVSDPTWDMNSGEGGINFLDAIGLRYYLPAIMTRCLNEGQDHSVLGFAFGLTLPKEPRARDWMLDRWKLLDDDQRKCIRQFIEFMAASGGDHSIDYAKALDRYWSSC